jgi:hypothetical protein
VRLLPPHVKVYFISHSVFNASHATVNTCPVFKTSQQSCKAICLANFFDIEFAAFLELAKPGKQMKGKARHRLFLLLLIVSSCGFIQTSQNSNSIAAKAQYRMDYMEYNQAIQYLNLILLVDSRIENVRSKLGFCYYRIGEKLLNIFLKIGWPKNKPIGC